MRAALWTIYINLHNYSQLKIKSKLVNLAQTQFISNFSTHLIGMPKVVPNSDRPYTNITYSKLNVLQPPHRKSPLRVHKLLSRGGLVVVSKGAGGPSIRPCHTIALWTGGSGTYYKASIIDVMLAAPLWAENRGPTIPVLLSILLFIYR